MFLPYACPKCGHSIVFKRILTYAEAAYVSGLTENYLRWCVGRRELKFKYWTNNGKKLKPVRVIDAVDLLEFLRNRYQYEDEVDPNSRSGRWIEMRRRGTVKRIKNWQRNKAAKAAALIASQGKVTDYPEAPAEEPTAPAQDET